MKTETDFTVRPSDELQECIGYWFRNDVLLTEALTHSSYCNENKHKMLSHNERLEFLGDSILGFVTAEYLFCGNRPLPEGKMTKVRADYVCESALYAVSCRLGLSENLRLGKGEISSGGKERVSILADIVEAVIAAIYLDGGMEPAKSFILNKVLCDIDFSAPVGKRDYKSALQEEIQKNPNAVIEYRLIDESGPDHDKTFYAAVFVNGNCCGEGSGKTKKEAEQYSARQALEALKK